MRDEARRARQWREVRLSLGAEQSQRLIGLFVLGCLLFSYPLLALFNVGTTVLGVPLLYAWLFGSWSALIALMALAVTRTG